MFPFLELHKSATIPDQSAPAPISSSCSGAGWAGSPGLCGRLMAVRRKPKRQRQRGRGAQGSPCGVGHGSTRRRSASRLTCCTTLASPWARVGDRLLTTPRACRELGSREGGSTDGGKRGGRLRRWRRPEGEPSWHAAGCPPVAARRTGRAPAPPTLRAGRLAGRRNFGSNDRTHRIEAMGFSRIEWRALTAPPVRFVSLTQARAPAEIRASLSPSKCIRRSAASSEPLARRYTVLWHPDTLSPGWREPAG